MLDHYVIGLNISHIIIPRLKYHCILKNSQVLAWTMYLDVCVLEVQQQCVSAGISTAINIVLVPGSTTPVSHRRPRSFERRCCMQLSKKIDSSKRNIDRKIILLQLPKQISPIADQALLMKNQCKSYRSIPFRVWIVFHNC